MDDLTEKQLETLATRVMGWVESNNGQLWHSTDKSMVGLHKKKWCPDEDLNQTLPLLDKFNANKTLCPALESEIKVETLDNGDGWIVDSVVVEEAKDIAPELCKAMLERLEG